MLHATPTYVKQYMERRTRANSGELRRGAVRLTGAIIGRSPGRTSGKGITSQAKVCEMNIRSLGRVVVAIALVVGLSHASAHAQQELASVEQLKTEAFKALRGGNFDRT